MIKTYLETMKENEKNLMVEMKMRQTDRQTDRQRQRQREYNYLKKTHPKILDSLTSLGMKTLRIFECIITHTYTF